jgi:hypothetical protein
MMIENGFIDTRKVGPNSIRTDTEKGRYDKPFLLTQEAGRRECQQYLEEGGTDHFYQLNGPFSLAERRKPGIANRA